jgi:hypothetical protein
LNFTNKKTNNIIGWMAKGILWQGVRVTTSEQGPVILSPSRKKEDIQWVLPTSRSSAVIAAKSLPSPQRSKNFSSRKAIPTSLSGVFPAGRTGKRKKAAGHAVLCRNTRLFAHSAERKPKYPSSPNRADRFIAALATAR